MRVGSVGTKSGASGRAGFTLTELLVVMVIIGILAAILFPIFAKAKESGRTTECLSNLRQLGSGLTLYLDSFDSRFPAAASWGSPDYWHNSRYGSQRTIQELLKPYVKNGMNTEKILPNGTRVYGMHSVFVCPSDIGVPGKSTVNGCPPSGPIWRYAGCSYEYYATNQVDWDTMRTILWTGLSPEVYSMRARYERVGAPLSKVVYPTRKAVMGDLWYWHMGDGVSTSGSSDLSTQPRLAFRNTLFADGHAARVNGRDHESARTQQLRPMWHSLSEVPDD